MLLTEPRTAPAMPGARAHTQSARPHEIASLRSSGAAALPYFLYVPERRDPLAPVLVAVHGISRNAREHAEVLSGYARETGRVLVAPLFPEDTCRRYQRLGRDACRADAALFEVLADVTALTGIDSARFDLFGFSAGAQFAHRFAMLHPRRVGRLMLSSAGWYTHADPSARFPYGVSDETRRGRRAARNLKRFLAIPMLVMVGERDVLRDRGLRKEARLDRVQGESRVERAARWTRALREHAAGVGIASEISFRTLPHCGHSFTECVHRGGLVEQIRDWLGREGRSGLRSAGVAAGGD